MKQEITLEELRSLAETLEDGQIIRITFRGEEKEKGGRCDDKKLLSDAGSLDPP